MKGHALVRDGVQGGEERGAVGMFRPFLVYPCVLSSTSCTTRCAIERRGRARVRIALWARLLRERILGPASGADETPNPSGRDRIGDRCSRIARSARRRAMTGAAHRAGAGVRLVSCLLRDRRESCMSVLFGFCDSLRGVRVAGRRCLWPLWVVRVTYVCLLRVRVRPAAVVTRAACDCVCL